MQHSPRGFTFVNGERVTGSRVLRSGDRIQISDAVLLEVCALAGSTPDPQLHRRFVDLSDAMEERLRLEAEIEKEFWRRGSMFDVDVVDSSGMKVPPAVPAHIILSFERFRAFVEQVIREFSGVVLNSNGDELMCFFEGAEQAVRAGSRLIRGLEAFNATQNLLERPFRCRIGIHSGECLVDLANGRAFSSVLDVAGHLQKAAEVNGMLVSEDTFRALPEGLPLEPVRSYP